VDCSEKPSTRCDGVPGQIRGEHVAVDLGYALRSDDLRAGVDEPSPPAKLA
jgi:hypothetical protein